MKKQAEVRTPAQEMPDRLWVVSGKDLFNGELLPARAGTAPKAIVVGVNVVAFLSSHVKSHMLHLNAQGRELRYAIARILPSHLTSVNGKLLDGM